ncbi:hypothetical protein [Vibrio parahaemolyticus]|uniref:hypothetical protein n=1 Tax=Vibrio parahaemolyticus TaxID=670 RepID=UPI00297006D2|nr:hypothetical protein [Vibrio parahaemolyticus]WOZ67725.1 hypothetical protein RHS39_24765 [Vibrio parahaemolyticus]
MKGTSLILFGILFGIFLPEALIPNQEFAKSLPPIWLKIWKYSRTLQFFQYMERGTVLFTWSCLACFLAVVEELILLFFLSVGLIIQ